MLCKKQQQPMVGGIGLFKGFQTRIIGLVGGQKIPHLHIHLIGAFLHDAFD